MNFKIVKITKKDLKDCQSLLMKAGLVDLEERRAYPERLYVSKQDYAALEANVKKAAKKQFPYLPAKRLKSVVGLEMINLAPNGSLLDALKPGIALVEVTNDTDT